MAKRRKPVPKSAPGYESAAEDSGHQEITGTPDEIHRSHATHVNSAMVSRITPASAPDKTVYYDSYTGRAHVIGEKEPLFRGMAGTNYGGRGGFNNPDRDHIKNGGPPPKGTYSLSRFHTHTLMGGNVSAYSTVMTPDGENNMRGRDGFLLHGGVNYTPAKMAGLGMESAGCITLKTADQTREVEKIFKKADIQRMVVYDSRKIENPFTPDGLFNASAVYASLGRTVPPVVVAALQAGQNRKSIAVADPQGPRVTVETIRPFSDEPGAPERVLMAAAPPVAPAPQGARELEGGRPLRYLIGGDAGRGEPGVVTEVGYDAGPVSRGINIGYVNLFDEKNTGRYGPYLDTSNTARNYREGQINPRGPGWEKNLREQFERRQQQGIKYVELDNGDAYKLKDVVGAVDLAASYGLSVVVKNPGLMEEKERGSAAALLRHPHVVGAIIEREGGTPAQLAGWRAEAGKPSLPAWFVAHGDGKEWAQGAAATIRESKLSNMGVTYSSQGEYANAEDVLPRAQMIRLASVNAAPVPDTLPDDRQRIAAENLKNGIASLEAQLPDPIPAFDSDAVRSEILKQRIDNAPSVAAADAPNDEAEKPGLLARAGGAVKSWVQDAIRLAQGPRPTEPGGMAALGFALGTGTKNTVIAALTPSAPVETAQTPLPETPAGEMPSAQAGLSDEQQRKIAARIAGRGNHRAPELPPGVEATAVAQTVIRAGKSDRAALADISLASVRSAVGLPQTAPQTVAAQEPPKMTDAEWRQQRLAERRLKRAERELAANLPERPPLSPEEMFKASAALPKPAVVASAAPSKPSLPEWKLTDEEKERLPNMAGLPKAGALGFAATGGDYQSWLAMNSQALNLAANLKGDDKIKWPDPPLPAPAIAEAVPAEAIPAVAEAARSAAPPQMASVARTAAAGLPNPESFAHLPPAQRRKLEAAATKAYAAAEPGKALKEAQLRQIEYYVKTGKGAPEGYESHDRVMKRKFQYELAAATGLTEGLGDGVVGKKTLHAMREAERIKKGDEKAIAAAEKRKEELRKSAPQEQASVVDDTAKKQKQAKLKNRKDSEKKWAGVATAPGASA